MDNDEILELAKGAVELHLRPLGKVAVRHDAPLVAAPAATLAAKDNMVERLAKRVGATLRSAQPDSADVEFVEQTPLGKRTTVVHVRGGKVERVVKTG